ncbi:MAG: hypothetical protein ACFFDB_18605 [Promethearchaeota archaeon]
MEPKKKRLLFFYIILTIPAGFLLFNLLWAISLQEGDPLLRTIHLIDISLMLSLTLIGFISYLIERKFKRVDKDGEDKRSRFKDFSKQDKIMTFFILFSCLLMSLSIFVGEYLLIFLGSNFLTDLFVIFEYIGIGLFVIGVVLILK